MILYRQLKLMSKTIQIDPNPKHTQLKVQNYKLHFDIITICYIQRNRIHLTPKPQLATST